MTPFVGEVVLITGAGSGLGRVMARKLTECGAKVGGIDRDADSLKSLGAELVDRDYARAVADVTDRAALADAVAALESALGPTDRLIANAGIGRATPADGFVTGDFEDIVRVNLIGVGNSVAAVLPGMLRRNRGHLVAMSSLASFLGLPRLAGYCASKAGVNALFDSLAAELRGTGVDVTTVCPGWVRTPLTDQMKEPPPGMLEAGDAVQHILTAVAARKRFVAFPRRSARVLRVLRWLPLTWRDGVLAKRHRRIVGTT